MPDGVNNDVFINLPGKCINPTLNGESDKVLMILIADL
jgi:hypothetical protein